MNHVAVRPVRSLPRSVILSRLRKRGLGLHDIARPAGTTIGYVSHVLARRAGTTALTERIWREVERALGGTLR